MLLCLGILVLVKNLNLKYCVSMKTCFVRVKMHVGNVDSSHCQCVCMPCSHQEYIVDNETYMRVKFYVDGSKRKGTVHVDLKKVRNLL